MANDMIFSGVDNEPINSAMEQLYINPIAKLNEYSEDIHVRARIAYGKTADHKLYLESAYTTQIDQADMEDAFEKNMLLVKVGTDFFKPVSMSGNVVLTIAKTGAGASAFDATSTYNVGDRCTKDGKIYQCITAISVAAAWDASKWTELTSTDWVEWAAKATE